MDGIDSSGDQVALSSRTRFACVFVKLSSFMSGTILWNCSLTLTHTCKIHDRWFKASKLNVTERFHVFMIFQSEVETEEHGRGGRGSGPGGR